MLDTKVRHSINIKYKIDFKESIFLQCALRASFEVINAFYKEKDLDKPCKKGYGGDISLKADLISEEIYCKYLLEFFDVLSEEGGYISSNKILKEDIKENAKEVIRQDVKQASIKDSKSQNRYDISKNRFQVVLDPLDGSNNFASNIPYYGASLALFDTIKSETIEGFVINFATLEIAYSKKDMDIYYFKLNLDSKKQDIKSFICTNNLITNTNLKCGVFEKANFYPSYISRLNASNLKFRSLGASALSLAFSFRYNFVFMPDEIRIYDALAGLFISRNLHMYGDLSYIKDKIPSINNEGCSKYLFITNNLEAFEKFKGFNDGIC